MHPCTLFSLCSRVDAVAKSCRIIVCIAAAAWNENVEVGSVRVLW
uniref:Uncharacterized protein n=1 Tax=Rhizophora mucronata TaxID=61149 RepID=A0A2P2PCX0_RHIMU